MAPSKNGKSYKRLAVLQPVGSAAAAGLRYVSDAAPAASARSPFRLRGARCGSVRALTATCRPPGATRAGASTMNFRFRGKSGVRHQFALNDRKLAATVRRMRDLPGYELFQYVDEK